MLIKIPHLGIAFPADDFLGTVATVAYTRGWELNEPKNSDLPWTITPEASLTVRYYVRRQETVHPEEHENGKGKSMAAPAASRMLTAWDEVWKTDTAEFSSDTLKLPAIGNPTPIANCREFLELLDDAGRARLSGWLQAASIYLHEKTKYEQDLVAFTQAEEAARVQGTIPTVTAPTSIAPEREGVYKHHVENMRKLISSAISEQREIPVAEYLKRIKNPENHKKISNELAELTELHCEKIYESVNAALSAVAATD
jgi:hypothetical protein